MPPLTEAAPGVWTAHSALWSTSCTVVVAADNTCLVVDPGVTVAEVADVAQAIRARGWRPAAGFSTHPHWDHLLWSADLGDVPRWATPGAVRLAAERRSQILAEADERAPGHDHRLTAHLDPLPDAAGEVPWPGPRAVVVGYRAHCAGSAALLLPSAGVLIAGDVLSDTEIPLLDLETADPVGDYRAMLDLLEEAAAAADLRVLISGHGTVTDRAGLHRRADADRAYLDALASDDQFDERLTDPWVVSEHERQVRWARGER